MCAATIHRPYPGVALVVTEKGSALLGAPADAFKATKAYCQKHSVAFPRVLVAPQRLLAYANPQFVPEFFLYEFLFIYGAAFKPELANERLQLVLDADQVEDERRALLVTLNGPSRADLEGYLDAAGKPILAPAVVERLANVAEHLTIKKAGRARTLDEMILTPTFDRDGAVTLLDGALRLQRTGAASFLVQSGGVEERVDLDFTPPVVPFADLPVPKEPQSPLTFGIKALGTRSGFDLSGPTTGFVFWLNGRALVYDGPVGTRYLLEHQGISPADISGVVLSHCHEDHMGAFVELILSGARPRVYTAEPIYRSMLVKLAHHFHLPQEEVARFVDYERVTPGTPIELLGATLDFFYTAHAIPTIGLRISMPGPNGRMYRAQISGDTMHHEGLDKMRAENVLSTDAFAELKHLVPDEKVDDAVYLADVGEALIHGNPKDWQGNPNRLLYYHCADDTRLRSFGHDVAEPGKTYTFIERSTLHSSVPGRLLHALRFLDLSDPAWLAMLLKGGRLRTAAVGDALVEKGATTSFSVIVSGAAAVLDGAGKSLAILTPGEFFGAIELVDQDRRARAQVRAETPMELFEIDADLFYEFVAASGQQATLARAFATRPSIDGTKLFRSLDSAARNALGTKAVLVEAAHGEVLVEQGTRGDDFFILTAGKVALEVSGKPLRELDATDADNFFGEVAALHPERNRNFTARCKGATRLLRVPGAEVRQLFERDMAIRYALVMSMTTRFEP